MSPKEIANQNLANTMIKNMAKKNMEGYYCATSAEAVEKALSLMPEGASVTWGGSMTLTECGLMDALKTANYEIIDRDTAKTPEEARVMYSKQVMADYYLMSTNALTIDGELVNIDGRANRVSCLCWGPQNVIIIAGMNKVAPDVESAIKRVRNIAAPPNCVRLNKNTPCAQTGKCGDCYSPESICSQILVTRRSSAPNRIKVILVGEELGY
jgi:hypothetical protein